MKYINDIEKLAKDSEKENLAPEIIINLMV